MNFLKKKSKAIISKVTILAMVFSFVTSTFVGDYEVSASNEVELTILHTNDTHGRVVADKDTIGIDTIAAIKKSKPDSLLLDLGDTLHGLPFATMNKGLDIVNLMKMAQYDIMIPGNHDFNYGYQRLVELANTAKTGSNAFDILAANVTKGGSPILAPNTIKDMNGIKVGFFGLASEETAYKTNPANVAGIVFENSIEIAKQQVKTLEANGAEVIIALSHLGTDEATINTSIKLAEQVPGIDVIFDAHSHDLFTNGRPAANNTLIVSTGEYGKNLGEVTLTVDATTKEVTAKSAALITKATASTSFTPDSAVKTTIDQIAANQDIILAQKVGTTNVDLNGARESVRTGETNLGNLLTDAMIHATGADIAITNGGGIRASIATGDITKRHIVSVLPFGNYIVTKKLTGSQIKEVLEHGVSSYPAQLGAFAHVGGLKFKFDPSFDAGSRVYAITFDGKPIDMDKEYLVATNDFLASGGDKYPAFGDVKTENEFSALEEALETFVKKLGTVNYTVEGRIVAEDLAIHNQAAADEVIQLIGDLPTTITLNEKGLVAAVRAAFNLLTEDQKALVTNYDVLVLAEDTIQKLEEEVTPVPPTTEPETPETDKDTDTEVKDEESKEEQLPGTDKEESPQTGDKNIFGWVAILFGAIAAVVVLEKKKAIEA